MPFVVTCIDLEDVTLNECYIEKDRYYIIFTYTWNLKNKTNDKMQQNRSRVIDIENIMCLCLVAQSCPTLCDPLDCSPPGSSVHQGFSRQECWSGLLSPPPWDLLNPGIKPRSTALQADSLLSEPARKPREYNTEF